MKRIPLTQGLYVLVDDEDFEYLNQWNWYAHKQGNTYYAKRTTGKDYKVIIVHMHRVISNVPTNKIVDHVDGNGLNNQKDNLRVCNKAQNGMNRPKQNNNTSGYKGVGWDKSRNKWKAQITLDGKNRLIGRFENLQDAARAYNNEAVKLHGEFAHLNILED